MGHTGTREDPTSHFVRRELAYCDWELKGCMRIGWYGPTLNTVRDQWRQRAMEEGDIAVKEISNMTGSLRSVYFVGCAALLEVWLSLLLKISPRSANQLRCDRLPFSRKLRRLIALQGLARVRERRERTVGIWREVWLGYGRRHTSIPKDTYHFPCRRPAHPRTSPTTRLPGDGGWQRRNRSHGAPPLLQKVAAVRQTALSPSARYT